MYNHSKYQWLKKRWYFLFLLVPILVLGGVAVVMFLWNSLMPPIFNLHPITYWQAFGLLVLSRILFGGFRGVHKHHYPSYSHHFKERWLKMSEEERQKYKEEWKKCCSPGKEQL